MIKANAHKYSVSAMCRVLQVNRSTYYYEAAESKDESELTADIREIFRKSRNHYGTRKIKKKLVDDGKQVSRRRIGRIMKQEVPIQKCVSSPLQRVHMVCIDENGQYTSTDSFKYCSRVIHKELLLAFDYHSLRHTHATLLIENGADVKDVQTRLGHTNIETTLQTYVHDTEKMVERSVDLFEQVTRAKAS